MPLIMLEEGLMLSVNIGILGYGYMGKWHHDKIEMLEDARVTSACDINPARLQEARLRKLKTYSNVESFLNDDLDLVIVATPNNLHKQLSIQALKARKNVLCEKPVTLNTTQLDEVLDVAAQSGKNFTTHFNRRWDVDYLVICEAIKKGYIGETFSIESRVLGERGAMFGWRADPEFGGGMLLDWGPHLIDQILTLNHGNKVKTIFAQIRSVLTPHVDDYCKLELLFQNGLSAHIEMGTFSLTKLPRWFAYGNHGTMKLNDFSGKTGEILTIKTNGDYLDSSNEVGVIGPSRTLNPLSRDRIERIDLPEIQAESLAFYNNLLNVIKGREDSVVSYQDLRRCMLVIDAAFQSGKVHCSLDVDI
jgi:scyllo-inositol 2-dehydrogenase (NADP+)